jgi:hypothetical protein
MLSCLPSGHAVRVGGDEQRLLALLAHVQRELRGGGGLT